MFRINNLTIPVLVLCIVILFYIYKNSYKREFFQKFSDELKGKQNIYTQQKDGSFSGPLSYNTAKSIYFSPLTNEKNRLKNLNLKYSPGTNPDYALNVPMPPPDGKNNAYSNSGADGRYKDTKMLYEKDYLTTINLIIGILISLSVIAKKSN